MSDATHSQLAIAFLDLDMRLRRCLGGALSIHGLGVSEFLVLRQLGTAQAQTMRRVDLAQAVGLTASGITRLLNPMQKTGLVVKKASAHDARVSLVVLSKAGAQVLKDADIAFAAAAEGLLEQITPVQREQWISSLSAIR